MSPELRWGGVPTRAESLVLMMDDPDIPFPWLHLMTWTHWIVYDIPIILRGLTRKWDVWVVHDQDKALGARGHAAPAEFGRHIASTTRMVDRHRSVVLECRTGEGQGVLMRHCRLLGLATGLISWGS